MKKVFLALAAAAMIFVGCSKDEDNLADKTQGKWILSTNDGQAVPTNLKFVTTFEANGKGHISASASDEVIVWDNGDEFTYSIDGNVVSWTRQRDDMQMKTKWIVKSINDNSMDVEFQSSIVRGGIEEPLPTMNMTVTRVTKDYSADVLGMWEGRSTGEHSEFDDGENHRWEYLANGTFRYYHKVDGAWQLSNDEYAKYFVDGNLLCTCWKNNGAGNEEHREWWKIASIENNTMNWTALRMNPDGTTYTATFQMVKVPEN